MSAASEHVASALDALAGKCLAAGDMGKVLLLNEATVHALLAIEARLGELVDAQHTATLLAGSAYGMTDPGGVQQLVNSIGDAMYRATTGGER